MQAAGEKLNNGCLHFQRLDYLSAIKQWRIAVDQMLMSMKVERSAIMRNIGIAFIQLERYQDAMVAFEGALDIYPDYCTAYNLAVMAYALGEPDNMKSAFLTLIQVYKAAETRSNSNLQDHHDDVDGEAASLRTASEQVLHAVRLIAPAVNAAAEPHPARSGSATSADGWGWCADALAAAGLQQLADEAHMAAVCPHMQEFKFESAEQTLQEFEVTGLQGKGPAAVSLSSLRLLQSRPQEAEAFAEMALADNPTDLLALTCLGNAQAAAGNLEQARDLFAHALAVDGSSYHTQYNYGLVSKRLGYLEDALSVFRRLHDVTPDSADVMSQVADVLDQKQDFNEAVLWLERLHTLVPGDSGILVKLASVHAKLGATHEAARCLEEAHTTAPTNLVVLSSLLDLLMDHKAFVRAAPVVEAASLLQPQEVKWKLMHALCLRQTRPAPVALAAYHKVHSAHPHNLECLAQLFQICTNLGMHEDAQAFAEKAQRVERASTAQQVVWPASWGGSHLLQSNSNPNSSLARPQTGAAVGGLAVGGPSQSNLDLNAQPSVSVRPGSANSVRPATAARFGVQSSVMGSASGGSSANHTWSRTSKSTFGMESLQLSQKLGSIASGKKASQASETWRHHNAVADLLPG